MEVDEETDTVFADRDLLGNVAVDHAVVGLDPLFCPHPGIGFVDDPFGGEETDERIEDRLALEFHTQRIDLDADVAVVPVDDKAREKIGFGMDQAVGIRCLGNTGPFGEGACNPCGKKRFVDLARFEREDPQGDLAFAVEVPARQKRSLGGENIDNLTVFDITGGDEFVLIDPSEIAAELSGGMFGDGNLVHGFPVSNRSVIVAQER